MKLREKANPRFLVHLLQALKARKIINTTLKILFIKQMRIGKQSEMHPLSLQMLLWEEYANIFCHAL